VWAIAQIEIKNLLRNKVIYIIFTLSIFFILAGRGCNAGHVTGTGLMVNQEVRHNMTVLAVFHIIALWSMGLCGLIAAGILPKEFEEKTLIMVLSRPIARIKFLIGKCVPVVFISSGILLLLVSVLFIMLFIDSGHVNKNFFYGFLLLQLNILFVAVSSFFFSLFVPRIISPFLGFLIYITSIILELPFYFDKLKVIWKPSEMFITVHSFFPQLGSVQFLSGAFIGAVPDLHDCIMPAVNVALYSVLLWLAVIVMFEKKQI
jgi:ABC-type transport system involved in multi-copper enzyme maturation permease subunit